MGLTRIVRMYTEREFDPRRRNSIDEAINSFISNPSYLARAKEFVYKPTINANGTSGKYQDIPTKQVYNPDSPFLLDNGLIYLLQRDGHRAQCNDITINVAQAFGGSNKMPTDLVERLTVHLTQAANNFLLEECGYTPEKTTK